jgi:hypothetical protein
MEEAFDMFCFKLSISVKILGQQLKILITVTYKMFFVFFKNNIAIWSWPLTSQNLKQHASRFMLILMKILKMYFKVKYCEVNKSSNLHIANGTYNPCLLLKRSQNIQKYFLLR